MSMTEQAPGFARVPIGSQHPARAHEIRFRDECGPLAGYTVRLSEEAAAKWMALGVDGFVGEAATHGEAMRLIVALWLTSQASWSAG